MRGVKHVKRWEAAVLDGEAATRQRILLRRRHSVAPHDRNDPRDLVDVRHRSTHHRRSDRVALVGSAAKRLGVAR